MQRIQSFPAKKLSTAFYLFLLFSTLGCEKEHSKELDSIISKTLKVSDAALSQVENLSSEDAKTEFRKLAQYEYQVMSVAKEISAKELEGKLAVYGTQGYDCSGPILRTEDLLLVCKKRPESVLRYIPQTLVGRP